MSGNVFFISDTHFGHEKCCTTFLRKDGSPLRPFSNAQEMDEELVRRWNEVVREQDKVYHLGDVVISKKYLDVVKRLNGAKRLIRGNHDLFKTKEYIEVGFKEIYGVRVLEDMVLTHVPLHPVCITERWNVNVHGHLHANLMEKTISVPDLPPGLECFGPTPMKDIQVEDPLYVNVSVEQIDYRPIELSELRARIAKNRETAGEPNHGEYVHRKDTAS